MVRSWAGTRRVGVPPPPGETDIAPRNRGPANRRMEARWPGGLSSCWLRRGRRLRNDCRHHGLDEHAVSHGTVKVPLALDASIVLPRLLLELDANPFAHLEVSLAGKPHGGLAAIAEQDCLPRLKVRHYDDGAEGGCCIMRLAALEIGGCSSILDASFLSPLKSAANTSGRSHRASEAVDTVYEATRE